MGEGEELEGETRRGRERESGEEKSTEAKVGNKDAKIGCIGNR